MTDKKPCATCGALATWNYGPIWYGPDEPPHSFCDEHVPRGCSCNLTDPQDATSTEQDRDEQGRLLPCVEYDFDPDGFEVAARDIGARVAPVSAQSNGRPQNPFNTNPIKEGET